MGEQNMYRQAEDALRRHGYSTARLALIGAGAQSTCYGTDEMAVLLSSSEVEHLADLTGHSIPDADDAITCNSYAALQWLTAHAADAGVRTPRIVATGQQPRPYAVIERANGKHATNHPRVTDDAPAWFGQLGEEIRKTHVVETTGFGMFVPDGSAEYQGRIDTWVDYLNRWLGVHLCVGQSRPEDVKVLGLLLAQDIVSERDLSLVESKVREAQEWPVKSVLTHYDNRLDNIVVDDAGRITMLDWGLSLAGIGIAQELIKLFETEPMSMESPRVAAFLHGYGLSDAESTKTIDDAKLMLVLDGLGMSYGWAGNPDRLQGVRGWLQTVRRICRTW